MMYYWDKVYLDPAKAIMDSPNFKRDCFNGFLNFFVGKL